MRQIILILLLSICLFGCKSNTEKGKHVFYLHGRIVELQGINATSEKYGKYEYEAIIKTLKTTGAEIHNELRTSQTDFQEYCEKISSQIDKLIEKGINPINITVIGASKGAVMAMNISSINTHAINYVLLAANNEQIENENQWILHGRILGIYEKSDLLAGKNYNYWINKSSDALEFKQIQINTGLGHGFLYRPLSEWVNPTKEWIEN